MKNKRKLFISVLAAIMAAILLFGLVAGVLPYLVNAKGESAGELKQQLDALKGEKDKIDEEIEKLEGQLSTNLTDMQAMVDQKNTIDQEIFMLYQKMENLNEQIATYGNLIADKQEELDAAQARLSELNAKNKERIRAMEEDGTLSYWSVLFKANSFADLLDRLNMVEEIAAADQRRLKEISDAAKEVEEVKATLETEKAALEENKKALADAQAKLEERRAEADKLLADLVATGQEYQALLDAAESEAGALQDDIEEVKVAYDNAKYQEWLSTSVPPTTSSAPSGGNAGNGSASYSYGVAFGFCL